MFKSTVSAFLCVVSAILLSSSLKADIPRLVNYQGRLLNSTGVPIKDTLGITFVLYRDAGGANQLWTETHNSVPILEGLFHVLLGTYQPLPQSVFHSDEVWLGVRVEGGEEQHPLTRLASVGWAYHAAYADSTPISNLWNALGDTVFRSVGRVGIGTSSPLAKLDIVMPENENNVLRIKATTNAETRFLVEDGLGGYGQIAKADYDLAGFSLANKDVGNALNLYATEGDVNIRVHPSSGATWEDQSLTKMQVSRFGNIGIGTTSPLHKLDIHTTNANLGLHWRVDSGIDAGAYCYLASNNGRGLLRLGNDSEFGQIVHTLGGWQWNTQLNLMGNVGIGTTSPEEVLHVAGGMRSRSHPSDPYYADFRSVYNYQESFLVRVRGGDPSETTILGFGGLATWLGSYGANKALYIQGTSGNVGIGTSSPASRLDVSGQILANTASSPVNAIQGTSSGSYSGVAGFNTGTGPGVYANSSSSSPDDPGIWAVNTSSSGFVKGVLGTTNSASGAGVFGSAISGGYGVYGVEPAGGGGWAVYADGDLRVSGTLSKAAGSFTIDHPLDPANKILQHSFVESPDMMNVYNGNVQLDDSGRAFVHLPDYFEALNRDFRYQLTAIGLPSPNLHVAVEVSNGRFVIAGGSPGSKVSWQVTGIRQDPYADKNRIQPVVEKSIDDRGKYLNPQVYGLGPELGMDRQCPVVSSWNISNGGQK